MDDENLFYTLFKIVTPNIYSLKETFDNNLFKDYDILLNSFHTTLKCTSKFIAMTMFLQNNFMNIESLYICDGHHRIGALNLISNIYKSENKRLKLGAAWDNHYKLIGKIKLDIFNKPFRNFRLQDELLFSGIKIISAPAAVPDSTAK